ncbi:MAG: sugar ABC transporter substrate-binding protein [Lachnospiraceae bacterium]|nr:sugar ABC transporter substrate-binding protein [Lachnospiraceae bacterium]
MRKRKLFMALLLTGVMVLTGCSSKEPEQEAPAASEEPTQEEEQEAPAEADASSEGAKASIYDSASTIYKAEGGNKIGITVIDNVIPHCQAFIEGAKSVIEENGDTAVVLDPGFDAVVQASNLDDFVAQNCVGIVCETIDGNALITSTQNAVDAGVMVASADFPFAEGYEHLVCSQVMTPNQESAAVLAEKMVEDIGEEGNIVILCRPDAGSQARADGFREVCAKYGLNIIFDGDGGGEVEKANSVMQDLLQANPQIDAVICSNDEQAIGAYTAAEAAGRAEEVHCYGFDGAPEALEFVKEGRESATLQQRPYEMGKQAALDLYKAMRGEDVGAAIKNVPYQVVTADNADEGIDTYYTGIPDYKFE